jgi:hypothetical protein
MNDEHITVLKAIISLVYDQYFGSDMEKLKKITKMKTRNSPEFRTQVLPECEAIPTIFQNYSAQTQLFERLKESKCCLNRYSE